MAQCGTAVVPQAMLEEAVTEFHNILVREQRDKLCQIGAVRDAETDMILTANLSREHQLPRGRGIANSVFNLTMFSRVHLTPEDTLRFPCLRLSLRQAYSYNSSEAIYRCSLAIIRPRVRDL
jgi:hypothetical protein